MWWCFSIPRAQIQSGADKFKTDRILAPYIGVSVVYTFRKQWQPTEKKNQCNNFALFKGSSSWILCQVSVVAQYCWGASILDVTSASWVVHTGEYLSAIGTPGAVREHGYERIHSKSMINVESTRTMILSTSIVIMYQLTLLILWFKKSSGSSRFTNC